MVKVTVFTSWRELTRLNQVAASLNMICLHGEGCIVNTYVIKLTALTFVGAFWKLNSFFWFVIMLDELQTPLSSPHSRMLSFN